MSTTDGNQTEKDNRDEAAFEELRRLDAAATPAPWMQGHHVDEPRAIVAEARPRESLLGLDRDGMAIVEREPDAALIVALRNTLPSLLDEWDRHGDTLREIVAWAEATANNATCSFCSTQQAAPEKRAAFAAHVVTCDKHPAAHAVDGLRGLIDDWRTQARAEGFGIREKALDDCADAAERLLVDVLKLAGVVERAP